MKNYSGLTRNGALFLLAGLMVSCALAARAEETPRAARSVHLGYHAPKGDVFYNQVTVKQTTPGSYFMACGWNTGYFGMQELGSPTNKVVIFSVWDPTHGDNPNNVPLDQRVEVLYSDPGAAIKRFGGEGTGGQCKWPYVWHINEACQFAVVAKVEGEKTTYAGWFFDGHAKEWRHLATFRVRTEGKPLNGYYSFVEDFRRDYQSVNVIRRAQFDNGWVRDLAGKWVSLQKANFTASDASWEARTNIDAGLAGDGFYLATGGDTASSRKLGSLIELADKLSPKPPQLPAEMFAAVDVAQSK